MLLKIFQNIEQNGALSNSFDDVFIKSPRWLFGEFSYETKWEQEKDWGRGRNPNLPLARVRAHTCVCLLRLLSLPTDLFLETDTLLRQEAPSSSQIKFHTQVCEVCLVRQH